MVKKPGSRASVGDDYLGNIHFVRHTHNAYDPQVSSSKSVKNANPSLQSPSNIGVKASDQEGFVVHFAAFLLVTDISKIV